MMMIIITRYPASEDRLIVRPLLSRVCALRLQPAEPQPYTRRFGSVQKKQLPGAPSAWHSGKKFIGCAAGALSVSGEGMWSQQPLLPFLQLPVAAVASQQRK